MDFLVKISKQDAIGDGFHWISRIECWVKYTFYFVCYANLSVLESKIILVF
jgi:hypothetical protein